MATSRKDIVLNLLKEAGYYWQDEFMDQVDAVNPDDYDPIVDKIFKANAIELEKLYAEIDESQRQVILGLSQTLVPGHSLLPEPGYTVAQLIPQASRLATDPTDQYEISGQSETGEQFEFYFTPLFEHVFPKTTLVAMVTENLAIQVEDNTPSVVKEVSKGISTPHLWLGLDIDRVKEGDSISFYLGNTITDEFDKNYFIFHKSRWLLNGEQELDVKMGIDSFEPEAEIGIKDDLMDRLEVKDTYERHIKSRFKNSFMYVPLPVDLDNLKHRVPPLYDGGELTSTLKVQKPICWIKVEFPLAIPNQFLIENLLYPNCIPLVNRKLISRNISRSNYERVMMPMPTTDYFLDIHRVQDADGRAKDTNYRRLDFLQTQSQPGTYTIRSGSRVHRLNRYDATDQIQRLLEIIHDEYSTFKEEGVNRLKQDFDTIEKAINRIKGQLPDYFRDDDMKSAFYCVANFKHSADRLYYDYWETQGDEIRFLGERSGLSVTSADVKLSESRTVIPIQKGKPELSEEDYINQLKISLLSRGKISTRADIDLFARSRYGRLLAIDSIGRELMMIQEGLQARGIVVTIRFVEHLTKAEREFIRIELQNDLNARSAFFTHIKVKIRDAA